MGSIVKPFVKYGFDGRLDKDKLHWLKLVQGLDLSELPTVDESIEAIEKATKKNIEKMDNYMDEFTMPKR
jgi:hypothetical protein